MCVRTIVDASAFRHFCATSRNSAGDQLRRWIDRGDGIVVFSATDETYARELDRYGDARKQLVDYYDRGRAVDIDAGPIQAVRDRIPSAPVRRSDDPHVLALAVASDATVLFSCDGPLRQDFADDQVIPKVGALRRSSVPDVLIHSPKDTSHAANRRKFLEKRKCPSSR